MAFLTRTADLGGKRFPSAKPQAVMALLTSQAEPTGTHVLSSISLRRLTCALCVAMMSCILMTYTMCINERHCPVFLPMISDSKLPISLAADGPQSCRTPQTVPALGV
jgi:hypothetical protein